MEPYELRVYTLRSKETLDFYVNHVYPRHLNSFPLFGITPRGIWTVRDGAKTQACVLVSYRQGSDPGEVVRRYMQSREFAEEIKDWDPSYITHVESTILIPPTASPRN